MESPFDILLIDADADEKEIERAYRERVKETHPDLGGSAEEFQRVRQAYEELTTASGRRERRVDRRDRIRDDPDEQSTDARVEYLNYEVLDDHGWALDDDDLFEKASAANLDPADYGRFLVQPNESLLQAAENRGFTWPYSCRGGACANCAIVVIEGEIEMPVDHILPPEMLERGIRLSCLGGPVTDDMKVVYNVKSLPDLEELRLPPHPFAKAERNV